MMEPCDLTNMVSLLEEEFGQNRGLSSKRSRDVSPHCLSNNVVSFFISFKQRSLRLLKK